MSVYNCIILSSVRYKENDLIIRSFTKEEGLLSFIHRAAFKTKKGAAKTAFYQVLSQNLITTSAKLNQDLKPVREINSNYIYSSLHTNIYKSSIAIFLAEVLTSAIKEEQQNIPLYEFLVSAFTYLDLNADYANFHLFFLIKLTKFLGFYPDNNAKSHKYFNLITGKFELNSDDNYVIEGESSFFMTAFLESDFESASNIKMNAKQRYNFLSSMLLYYELHLSGFKKPKSLEVLNTLFS